MNFTQRFVLLAAVALLPIRSASATPIVVNGSFELPNIASGSFALFPGGIPGWTVSSGPSIEIQDHVAGLPYAGDQFVELDSTGNSAMLQQLVTTPGESFVLSFAYSPRPGLAATSNGIQVYFNNLLLDTLALSGIGNPNTVWAVHSYGVTATAAITPLEFRAIGTSDSLGGYVDDVQANAVPEPASLLLLGFGLSTTVGRRLKQRFARRQA
jgi:hypothetical protein